MKNLDLHLCFHHPKKIEIKYAEVTANQEQLFGGVLTILNTFQREKSVIENPQSW